MQVAVKLYRRTYFLECLPGKYVPVYLNGKHSIKYDSQFKKTATGITLMQVAAKLYRRTYFLECLLLPRYLHAGHSNP